MENIIDWIKIEESYLNGKSLTKLEKETGISRRRITKYLKDKGIEIINRQNRVKFDENIFDTIDSEEKAYWLGFIYADGYISDNDYCIYKNVFELGLKLSDVEHLNKFNTFTKHISNNVKTDSYRCRWSIMNKHLWNVLNNYGCIPNKSLYLKFPNINIFKSHELIRHFLRGYFDGDGCITFHKYIHTVTPVTSVIGTKEFLLDFINYSKIPATFRHDSRHSECTFSLEYSKENAIKLINWLYNDCTIFLNRKYKLYNFFKNGSRSVQEWTELLSIKNGELCDENTVVTEETKESSAPYSVEIETELSE